MNFAKIRLSICAYGSVRFARYNLQSNFFEEITEKYKFFVGLSIDSKILFLFNSIDPFICRLVAAFFLDIINYRYQTLYHK